MVPPPARQVPEPVQTSPWFWQVGAGGTWQQISPLAHPVPFVKVPPAARQVPVPAHTFPWLLQVTKGVMASSAAGTSIADVSVPVVSCGAASGSLTPQAANITSITVHRLVVIRFT